MAEVLLLPHPRDLFGSLVAGAVVVRVVRVWTREHVVAWRGGEGEGEGGARGRGRGRGRAGGGGGGGGGGEREGSGRGEGGNETAYDDLDEGIGRGLGKHSAIFCQRSFPAVIWQVSIVWVGSRG